MLIIDCTMLNFTKKQKREINDFAQSILRNKDSIKEKFEEFGIFNLYQSSSLIR